MGTKLKYEHILETEKFKEFVSLVNQNIPISVSTWAKDLGFNNLTSFRDFMKRKGINYKRNTIINIMSNELKAQIISDYHNVLLTVEQIIKKYNLSNLAMLYKIIGNNKLRSVRRTRANTIESKIKHNTPIENSAFGNMKDLLDRYNVKYQIIKVSNFTLKFLVNCCECKKIVLLGSERFYDRLKDGAKIKCHKCYIKNHSTETQASRPLNKLMNTSGYIGVSARIPKGVPVGFIVVLESKSVKLISKCYNDPTLSEKTKIEAAVYREKYILENNLPHTRNFSDKELISNMEMLGEYSQLDGIKKLLGERKENG